MSPNRVYGVEWITGFAGVVLLATLFFPWFGDQTGFESMTVIRFFLVLTAVMAILLPLLVSMSAHTNVPITYETFTAAVASLALLLVVIRLIWSPDGSLRPAAMIGVLATAVLAAWAWKSVSRGG